MTVFLSIETSQPNGAIYRLAMGCNLRLSLASIVAVLARLF
jgi:hypothetical protein